MPSVSYDSKSFFLDGARSGIRRMALVGAVVDPALLASDDWTPTLRSLRRIGMNAVAVRVPWSLHEPTPGRFVFDGRCDLRRFLLEAGAADLRVLLRIGPCVGGSFARGGLPAWVPDLAGESIRDAAPAFMQRVTAWWRRLVREFADLQATRNGQGSERPVVAVGIENDWHSLDHEVGARYFGELVRYAREFGVEVPLVSVNNGWSTHEGIVDGWNLRGLAASARTGLELREVQPDAPPVLFRVAPTVAEVMGAIAARADFFIESAGGSHRTATAALGFAETTPIDLSHLRRALVFASSFGPLLAGLVPDRSAKADAGSAIADRAVLRGLGAERVFVGRAKSASDIAFHASALPLNGSRLEHCSGSLVAVAGELLVVAGRPRSRIRVRVDGSDASLTVPTESALPKVTRVRGLRIAVVAAPLAERISLEHDGFGFLDEAGTLVARVSSDGRVTREKARASVVSARPSVASARPSVASARPSVASARPSVASARPRSATLGPIEMLAEPELLDGTHARFASTAAPRSLGAYGVDSLHGYYRARLKLRGGARRMLALPFARLGSGRVAIDGETVARSRSPVFDLAPAKGPRSIVAEVMAPAFGMDAAPAGSCGELREGVFGPLVELAPLKGVRSDFIPMPAFDAESMGRFVLGYDLRDPARAAPRTLRWTFAARTRPVVMRIPAWWASASRGAAAGAARDALRLNGELVVAGQSAFSAELVWLDGARLSPMRPKALAKGEKPPKAKAVRLEPGANEVVLDLDHRADHDAGPDLERLRREVAFYEVRAEVPADWAFARIAPPATWARAVALPRRAAPAASGVPTWFRWSLATMASQACVLEVSFERGACATVFVNGACVIAQDGESGQPRGRGPRARLVRRARVDADLPAGARGEVVVFSPDGRVPALSLHES